jgi:DNA gyrase subunit A
MELKKEGDILKDVYIASTHDHLLFFTNLGRCYWLKAWQIPETGRRSKGKPIINMLEGLQSGERVAAALCVKDFEDPAGILLVTSKGVVKKTDLSAFSSPRRKGVIALNIDEGDEVIAARLTHEDEQIMLFTRAGMAVRFDQSEIRSMGRVARGVRGAMLKKGQNDCVVSCEVVRGDESLLIVCENGYGKRSKVDDFRKTKRGGVGVRSIITSERNGMVVSAIYVTDLDSVLMMSKGGQTVRISMKDVRIMGRSTQGVRLVQLKKSDYLVGIQKLQYIEEK